MRGLMSTVMYCAVPLKNDEEFLGYLSTGNWILLSIRS
jgi:hypothetical protein